MKKGILAVSFGSSYRETREKNIGGIEECIRKSYPGVKCYRAFTSDIIRKILEQRDGIAVMDVEQALLQMKADGVTHALIQPTHIIDGIENQKAQGIVRQFQEDFTYIGMAAPLLGGDEDFRKVVEILWTALESRVGHEGLVLMGHGSDHKANSAYGQLEASFHKAGHTKVFLATVEAGPTIKDVIRKLRQTECRRVVLAPFMIVAGDHAHNDMAGGGDSFYAQLLEQGYGTEIIMKGLGEYEGIRELFLSHLEKLMKEAEETV